MNKRAKLSFFFFLTFLSASLFGQTGEALYYMNLPQNHLFNPALRPTNSFYLGIGITGINANINNNFFNLSDILIPGRADSIVTFLHPDYDINDFLDKIKQNNFLDGKINVQLFGLGFNAGKDMYIFLDINERAEADISLPEDLIRICLAGNENYVGKSLDLKNLDAGLTYFREAGIGFSKMFGKNLRIGAKAKLLFGIAGFSFDNRNLKLTVGDDYAHAINADLTANISGPVDFYLDEDNYPDSVVVNDDILKSTKFFLNTKNRGFGIDIGAVYNFTQNLSISASITDLGFIRWHDRITNLKAESTFSFSGFNIKDVVNGTKTFDELADEMLDSLKNSFIVSNDKEPFNTFLSPEIAIGASYNITKKFGVGLLSRTHFETGHVRESFTISANLNLGNALSTTLAYTAANHRFDNLGAGLALRAGIFQFYVITDRIPLTWNKIISEDNEIPLPSNWNTLNIRFGLNLVLGNNIKKKTDKPMIII
ncbi:MAG TPA: DUF5723 family protein [Bacteroidales bacterium]|nr:DUF5723 family protein [Bacteroidales bacterium]